MSQTAQSKLYALDAPRLAGLKPNQPGLSSSERKYVLLQSSTDLQAEQFSMGSALIKEGEVPLTAYMVTKGTIELRTPGSPHLLGPGAVVGMAEGLANLPVLYGAYALTDVEVQALSVVDVEMSLERSSPKLRGILQLSIERILGDRFFASRVDSVFSTRGR
ncbi:MAG: hypothetical protein RLY67_958 [Pseudomonadota bacterium]|jgi:CRP-like cAMP-binding protein